MVNIKYASELNIDVVLTIIFAQYTVHNIIHYQV